jgi:hypothetical protein
VGPGGRSPLDASSYSRQHTSTMSSTTGDPTCPHASDEKHARRAPSPPSSLHVIFSESGRGRRPPSPIARIAETSIGFGVDSCAAELHRWSCPHYRSWLPLALACCHVPSSRSPLQSCLSKGQLPVESLLKCFLILQAGYCQLIIHQNR